MKESVLDILIYLFENFMDAELEPQPSRDLLKRELEMAGFADGDIGRALDWLDSLVDGKHAVAQQTAARAMRVFNGLEQLRLDTDCRGYILYLENIGILSATQREIVIDRLMALDADDIDIEKVKWVVLMVLFSQPGQSEAYARMEDLVFEERAEAVH
jgi:Smg protein